MANRRMIKLILSVTLICTSIAFLGSQNQAWAQQERIIRISTEALPGLTPRIEPKELWVRPGTVVVFVNWGRTEIAISFPKGKECGEATTAALGFKYKSEKGCLITEQYVPYGGTTSMKFEKIGTYDYEIEFIGRKLIEKGTIKVRPPA